MQADQDKQKNQQESQTIGQQQIEPKESKDLMDSTQAKTPAISMSIDSPQIKQISLKVFTMEQLPELVASINSTNPLHQLNSLMGLRKLLINDPQLCPKIMNEYQLLPHLLALAKNPAHALIQQEASWILCLLVSDEKADSSQIIKAGGLNINLQLLSSKHKPTVLNAVYFIGNVVKESHLYQEEIVSKGGLKKLVDIAKPFDKTNMSMKVVWAITNICRVKGGKYKKDDFAIVVPVFAEAMKIAKDQESLTDICWAFSHITERQPKMYQVVIDCGIPSHLVALLSSGYLSIVVPVLRTLGNITTGNSHQTKQIVQVGVLDHMQPLLAHHKKVIRRQCCWLISNLAAEKSLCQVIMKKQSLVQTLISIFINDEIQVRKEVGWIFGNLAQTADKQTIFDFALKHKITGLYVDCLKNQNSVDDALKCLYCFLKLGNLKSAAMGNPFLIELTENNGKKVLQDLSKSETQNRRKFAIKLMNQFYQQPHNQVSEQQTNEKKQQNYDQN